MPTIFLHIVLAKVNTAVTIVIATKPLLSLLPLLLLLLLKLSYYCATDHFDADTVAIPYTCGLSRPFSGAVAGEHSYIF